MRYAFGAKDTDPIVKRTNAGGKTTLVQDPSSYYVNKGYKNLNPQTTSSTGVKKQTSTATPTVQTVAATPTVDYAAESGGSDAFDWNAYFEELARQKQERADEAYKNNMQRIADAYASVASNLKSNYDSTSERLGASRDQSLADVNKDAESALRQAYINNMMTRKNLGQRLSALGYNGGAAESTMAQLENNYGNSRTGINETLNENIAKLNQNYGDNLASALQQYNSALSDLDMQKMNLEMEAEQQRQNAMDNFYSSVGSFATDPTYLNALQTALSNMSSYSYTPSLATNSYNPANVQQANSAANDANYAKYLAQARLDSTNGTTLKNIKNNLFNAVRSGELDINSLYSILKQLNVA